MIHVMCGIPASGKTTLSKQLALENNATLYCYDKLPKSYKFQETHLLMFNRIYRDLVHNRTVVCDDLHTTKEARMSLLNAISKTNCKKVLHVMNTPTEVCLERLQTRPKGNMQERFVTECAKKYEEPTLDEGWDEIRYHDSSKEVTSYGD